MKILFVCNRSPFAPDTGNAQRTNVCLNAFINNGHTVDVANIGASAEPEPKTNGNVRVVLWNKTHAWKISKTERRCVRLLIKAFNSSYELSTKISDIFEAENYDFIFCRYIETAELAGLYKYSNRLLLDIDDLPYKSYKVFFQESAIKKVYYWFKIKRLKKRTKWYINNCYKTFLPNKNEASEKGSVYLPNISTLQAEDVDYMENNHNVLFIGALSWPANYNGIDSFITHCWLKIKERVPDAALLIAGKGLPKSYEDKFSHYKDVKCLGFVESLSGFYSKGNIVICPIYSGGGTNIKVAEAMSVGKACVITSHAQRGYETIIIDDVNAKVVEDNNSFINSVVELLTNDSKCESIAGKALTASKVLLSQKSVDKIIGDCCKQ